MANIDTCSKGCLHVYTEEDQGQNLLRRQGGSQEIVSELKLLSKTTKLIQAVFYLFIMYSISLSIRLLLMVGWEVLMGIPKPSSQDNLW